MLGSYNYVYVISASDTVIEAGQQTVCIRRKVETYYVCLLISNVIQESGIAYVEVNAEEQPEEAARYKVMQAPTLVIIHDGKAESIVGQSAIRGWLKGKD